MNIRVEHAKRTISIFLDNARRLGTNNVKSPGNPVFDHLRPGYQDGLVREIALWIRIEHVQFEFQLRVHDGYPENSVLFKATIWGQIIGVEENIVSEEILAESRGPKLMGSPIDSLKPVDFSRRKLTKQGLYHEMSITEVLELAAANDLGFLRLVQQFNELSQHPPVDKNTN